MIDTQLVFVVGSGRCGTKMIKSLLAGTGIEARHEYVRNAYQREAALYYMGKLSFREMTERLVDIYKPAAYYSQSPIFLDSSHKLSWCIDVLAKAFPKAKFIHLVRDGRKVTSSFFYKLNIFDDHGAKVLNDWMLGKEKEMPPRTENYWQVAYNEPDCFKRICWHWKESNVNIMNMLINVRREQKLFIRLEDLAGDCDTMARFLKFLDVEPPYDSFMEAMQKPKHVYVPVDYKLTDEQQNHFAMICGDTMKELGYDMESEYNVSYKM